LRRTISAGGRWGRDSRQRSVPLVPAGGVELEAAGAKARRAVWVRAGALSVLPTGSNLTGNCSPAASKRSSLPARRPGTSAGLRMAWSSAAPDSLST
jgi:hypothetical protein